MITFTAGAIFGALALSATQRYRRWRKRREQMNNLARVWKEWNDGA
jgi:hypothetical protein